MKRLLAFLVWFAFSLSALQAGESSDPRSSPNIVLILTDDHGWSQMSLVADPRVPTLLQNPTASLDRPDNAVYFHRPGRGFSAIRQGDHKLMVFWRRNGTIARRELYELGKHPIEEGRDIADQNGSKADAMQATLLAFLKVVNAETPSDIPKRKRKNSKRSQNR